MEEENIKTTPLFDVVKIGSNPPSPANTVIMAASLSLSQANDRQKGGSSLLIPVLWYHFFGLTSFWFLNDKIIQYFGTLEI
jgi:hypothetical protein